MIIQADKLVVQTNITTQQSSALWDQLAPQQDSYQDNIEPSITSSKQNKEYPARDYQSADFIALNYARNVQQKPVDLDHLLSNTGNLEQVSLRFLDAKYFLDNPNQNFTISMNSEQTVLFGQFVELLSEQQKAEKKQKQLEQETFMIQGAQNFPSGLKFHSAQIVFLQKIGVGGQAEVQLAFDLQQRSFVVFKKFTQAPEYEHEKSIYRLIRQKAVSSYFLNVLAEIDQQHSFIIERGACDLNTFVEQRVVLQKMPFSQSELFYIMARLSEAICKLAKSADVFFCDLKEENVLLCASQQSGYELFLTDLGGAARGLEDYPHSLTLKYFSRKMLQKIYAIRQIDQEVSYEIAVQCECYTLGRTMQNILIKNYPKLFASKGAQFFQDQERVGEFLDILKQNIQLFSQQTNFVLILTKLLTFQYTSFTELESELICSTNFSLSDDNNCVLEWQTQQLSDKSDTELKTVQQLEEESDFFGQYTLHENRLITLKLLVERLRKQREQEQRDSIRLATHLSSLGNTQFYFGHFQEALGNLQESLKLKKQILGPFHESTACTLQSIGIMYRNMGELQCALENFEISHEILTALYGTEHVSSYFTLQNIGNILTQQSKFSFAQEKYEKALNIARQNFAPDSLEIGMILENIGILLSEQQRWEESLANYQEALRIKEKHFVNATDQVQIAETLENMAILYMQSEQYQLSKNFFERALATVKRKFDAKNLQIARILYNIGSLYERMQNFALAQRFYADCYNIYKEKLGEVHELTCRALTKLGDLSQNQDIFD